MLVDLSDDEIIIAEKKARKYLEYMVNDIVLDQELKKDQIRIIWKGIENFAYQANKEQK